MVPANAGVVARIDLSSQRMYVSVNGKPRYTWKVSTARRGYRTPRGTYRPYLLKRRHYSTIYHGSPMPYSIFFRRGYAIHGSPSVPAGPASHGCVRVTNQDMDWLRPSLEIGMPVVIYGLRTESPPAAVVDRPAVRSH